jgi:catechol 2,3-dioxygenase-like lactoylglutathione lyase family enzyme
MARTLIALAAAAGWALGQTAPPNATGISMGHLHLLVRDVDAHKKLWVDTLGGQVVKSGPLELIKFPGVFVGLRKGEPTGGSDDSSVNHLGFKVKDLEGTKAKLTAAGGKVVREMPATRQMFIMFPDGVKVEFTEDTAMTRPIEHHHVHFFTSSVEETRAFYVKHFSAIPGTRGKFEAADLPGVNLTFSPSETKSVGTRTRGVDHIGFEVKNLAEFCKKLEAAGVKFDRPYQDVPSIGLKVAFFTDPFGTYVELTEGLNKL